MVKAEQRPVATPEIDIYENDNEILLVADLPGVSSDNLKVNVDNGELILEAQRSLPTSGTLLGNEFRDCDFYRRFAVPPGIDGTKVTAELRNGVLQLHLPKSEALKPRQINVRAG
jgi:HSP20 family molecular chaperone IbpA